MRYEEIIKWSTVAVSCGAAIQLALFIIPALRGPGALIQILLAFAACAALAVIVANDRRNNGDLTRGGGRDELRMIGMFFVLWLAFAVMFRMSGIGGIAPAPASSAVAQRGSHNSHNSHNRDRDTRRDSRGYNDDFGRRCRGSYCVYEECHTSPKRRIETDVMKMLMSDYEVNLVNDSMQEFYVMFNGPEETAFAGGVWKIHVELPDQYPYKSPSIGFMNKIFHPNIDELSGSVCLDVINQTWSPMFDMINIFETFLPQLLRYPNPSDPLNGEAAALLMREPKSYESKVRDYVKRYASKEAAAAAAAEEEDDEDDEDAEMSSVGSFSEDEAPGQLEV